MDTTLCVKVTDVGIREEGRNKKSLGDHGQDEEEIEGRQVGHFYVEEDISCLKLIIS